MYVSLLPMILSLVTHITDARVAYEQMVKNSQQEGGEVVLDHRPLPRWVADIFCAIILSIH